MALIINADGTVDSQSVVVVHRVHPELDAAAVRWVRSALYWPACVEVQSVRVRVLVPVEFTNR